MSKYFKFGTNTSCIEKSLICDLFSHFSKNPLFPNTAPCTVFGATEMKLIMNKKVCHSDIVYNAAGLMAGSRKDICFKAR